MEGQGGCSAITLSHNGRFLLTGSEHGDVRLWEMRSRDLISPFKEHSLRITNICLFESDTVALTSSLDRSILTWDLRSEVCLNLPHKIMIILF